MFVAYLFSFVGLSLGAGLFPYDAQTQQIIEQRQRQDQIDVRNARLRMFPPVKFYARNYNFNFEVAFLPDDVWALICQHLGGHDLWSMNLVNKKLRSIIRPNLFDLLLDNSPNLRMDLLNILVESELTVRPEYACLLKVLPNEAPFLLRTVEKLEPESRAPGFEFSETTKLIPVHKSLIPRINDIWTLRTILTATYCPRKVNCDISSVAEDVYESYDADPENCKKYNYFPEADGLRLFQRVKPVLVFHSFLNSKKYRRMFLHCILSDYILPLWRLGGRLSFPRTGVETEADITALVDEMSALRSIVELNPGDMIGYFEYLHWALYLLTGTTRKSEKIRIRPVCAFLEGLGFDWKIIQSPSHSKLYYQNLEHSCSKRINYMLAVAHQWKFDLKTIVEALNGPRSAVCEQILAGEIPEIIEELAAINPRAIHFLMYGPMKFKSIVATDEIVQPTGQKRVREVIEVNDEADEPASKKQKTADAMQIAKPFSFEDLGDAFDRIQAELLRQFGGNEQLAFLYGAHYFQSLSKMDEGPSSLN